LKIPLLSLVDDITAISTLYSTTSLNKFAERAQHVLFVDVGGTSLKVYSVAFRFDKTRKVPFATMRTIATNWSEKVGGFFFAKAVAQKKGIPIHKATKLLIKTQGEGYGEICADLLEIIEKAVRGVLAEAGKIRAIDEVQLIGGASTFKFVVETIKRATNLTVRRDFNANEAVALGTVAAVMLNQGVGPFVPSVLTRIPSYDYNVTCGESTAVYCKGGNCSTSLRFDNQPAMCSEITISAPPDAVPSGLEAQLIHYVLQTPFTLPGDGNFSAELTLAPPDPFLTEVRWCSGEICNSSKAVPIRVNSSELTQSLTFVQEYLAQATNKEVRADVSRMLATANTVVAKADQANVEATHPVTDEVRATLTEINKLAEDDGLDKLGAIGLEDARGKLEGVFKTLHLKPTS
jgi:molecular chaperone DnaK (HSP70)